MNRYPLWKYVVIAVALVIGLLYTLPNLFPETPAVQVSSSKAGVKIDAALLQQVETALKEAGIPYQGDALDATGIKIRFTALYLGILLAAFGLRLVAPEAVAAFAWPGKLYLALLLTAIPLLTAVGWLGASLTFPVEKR